MLELLKAGWILIGCQSLYCSSAGKTKTSKKSDSTDIIPLSFYLYSCGVDYAILIELEQLYKLYSYSPWFEQPLKEHSTFF